MGKKVKKKGRTGHKEKRGSASSLKNVPQQCNPSSETVADGNTVVKGREPCIHFNKGVDLGKISAKFGLPEPIRCEDCREGTIDRRGNRAKGKHGKKGSGSVDSKSESKAIWVCLECGHFACGGVGLPTTPQSHAVRHARLTRHPLVIQFENPHLRWCFPCKMVIPVDKMEANDMILDIVKLVKGRSVKGPSVDGEDVWYGGGSVKNEKTPDNNLEIIPDNTLSGDLDERDSYVALTSAFRKLFDETSSGTGLRNVINPKSVFGCVCAKAPQFRGYQQQDSHELLRCLLDGLCTEELGARKRANSSQEDGISPNEAPTLWIQLYEPFLDLSLPVPTKKPPSRKTQPVSRPKKTKLPPKKAGRVRSKVNKDADSLVAQSVQHPSSDGDSSNQIQSSAPVAEKLVSSSGDSAGSDLVSPCAVADVKDSVSKNISTSEEFENKQVFENVTETKAAPSDDFTLLDALILLHVIQDSGNQDNVQNDVLLQNTSEFSSQVYPHKGEPNLKIDSCSANSWEEELPVQIQSSEVLLLPYKEETSTAVEITTGQVGPSVVSGSNEELLDFDGFGGLFDEPEAASGRIKTRTNLPNTISKIQMNGSEDKIQNGPFGLCKDISPDEVKDIDNENQNGLKLQTSQTVEVNPVVSQCEGGKSKMNYALPDLSHSSDTYKTCSQASLSDPASDSCSVHEPNSVGCNTGKQRNSQMLTGSLNQKKMRTRRWILKV
ncbi:Ubiquitin carboxyl-terminal hydrolase 2 [Vitis vinifera]|uniref:ubiquitinyl hydrolase 1 n=1 Tax=Vitis vinifera TaxID=29760 RepID=A0A438DYI3_VITVI|nr:Ubiquitin carboxyl-terminal hydrolase 2 [Vitis vinifera]